ncbi:hypothetical protein LTSEMIN_0262, partial [Salmonella enterica subsp. enterica serovar Minnesota str. A4-603]
ENRFSDYGLRMDAGLNAALILTRPVSIFWMMMKNSGC